ncbi:MAG: glycoside hydrolase family 44 protein [Polyangiaceae bacterium]
MPAACFLLPVRCLVLSSLLLACASCAPAKDQGAPRASVQTDGDAGGTDGGPQQDSPSQDLADAGTVTFRVDVTKGPARQFQPPATPAPVSKYIYGINAGLKGTSVSENLIARTTRWGLVRQGGDAYTPWNWTNNYNNAGSDYCFYQGVGLGGDALAGAITDPGGDTIPAAQAKGEAFLATVPIIDDVAAAVDNVVRPCPVAGTFCDGTSSSTRVNPNQWPFVTDSDAGDAGDPAFVPNAAAKPDGGYCTCSAACDGGCQVAASPVYQDEFVHYVRGAFGTGAPVFFSLDNEPNYWGGTHPELWPSTGAIPCQKYTVTYDDIVSRNIAFATAIKSAWPTTKVFGPVVAQDGIVYAHSYSDAHAPTEFLDYYLAQMRAASSAAGGPLLDALDVHYYTNNGNTPPGPAQCVQSPRLFWDPSYTALSAAKTASLDFGWTGVADYFSQAWYPRKFIPRLLAKIASAYPGDPAAPVLSISEYNNGCETDISGGVAQADVLGIFGREGVWAAAAWPSQPLADNYLLAAFDLYRNYDGEGAVVGDTAVYASTSDVADTSVYAFAHSDDSSAIDLVAINKTNAVVSATIQVAGSPGFAMASAFELVAGSAAVTPAPPAVPVTCSAGTCTLTYAMAPLSATTLIVR